MIQREKLGSLYSVDSVVEITRLYWHIMAHKACLNIESNANDKSSRTNIARGMLNCIKSYREDTPQEIQEKIHFEDLDSLEKRCNQILEEK